MFPSQCHVPAQLGIFLFRPYFIASPQASWQAIPSQRLLPNFCSVKPHPFPILRVSHSLLQTHLPVPESVPLIISQTASFQQLLPLTLYSRMPIHLAIELSCQILPCCFISVLNTFLWLLLSVLLESTVSSNQYPPRNSISFSLSYKSPEV